MNSRDLAKLSNQELLAIYNTHSTKPIKRFSNKKTALRQTQFLLDSLGTRAKIDAPTPPELAAAHRKTAANVLVAGVDSPNLQREYPSVQKAFESLKLPLKACPKFRRALKLAGTGTIEQFIFTVTYKKEDK